MLLLIYRSVPQKRILIIPIFHWKHKKNTNFNKLGVKCENVIKQICEGSYRHPKRGSFLLSEYVNSWINLKNTDKVRIYVELFQKIQLYSGKKKEARSIRKGGDA